jgi:hypothetical protein
MAFPEPVESSPAMLPALEGDLTAFPPADLYQFVTLLRLTGTLDFVHDPDRESERATLCLVRGRVVAAESSGPHSYLGELLVRTYGVPLEAVIDGLTLQNRARRVGRPAARLGQLLLEQRQVTPEVLRAALDDTVTRVAWRALSWESGRFSFWAGPRARDDGFAPAFDREAVRPDVSLEELLLRRNEEGESPA